ncbi:SRPBCC family protein [Ornithinimicrobium sp. LYQ92]|uniref:SRPBCC family protein n=1 Tax=Serinicoccus sp. LYQ92 TaxID=3378798 RepID=UPI003852EC73
MSQVTESVDVDVPIKVAYDQWTQFESFPEFMEGVESVTQVTDTRSHWKVEVGGVTREFDTEISEQHPEERVAWTTVDGDLKQAGVVTFHKLSDTTTRVTIQMDWAPEGLAEKAGALLGVDDRRVKGDARRFKEFIESRGMPTGGWEGDVPRD